MWVLTKRGCRLTWRGAVRRSGPEGLKALVMNSDQQSIERASA